MSKLTHEEQMAAVLAQIAELKAQNEALAAKAQNGGARPIQRVIKRNQAGGVYIRDPEFRAWSAKKEKYYTAGLNVDADVAAVLFMPNTDGSPNPILREVMAYVNSEFGANAERKAA